MTQDQDTPLYGIADLADLGGVSRRTVRYYVKRGLMPAPTGTGRGKHYTQAHLDALLKIKRLQEKGVSLSEIGVELDPKGERVESPPGRPSPVSVQAVWTRVVLDEGVELHLKGQRSALTLEVLESIRAHVLQALEASEI